MSPIKSKTRIVTNTQLTVATLAAVLSFGLAYASTPFNLNKKVSNVKSIQLGTVCKNNTYKNFKIVCKDGTVAQTPKDTCISVDKIKSGAEAACSKKTGIVPINNIPNIQLNDRPITLRTVVCLTRWTPETPRLNDAIIHAKITDVNNYYQEVLFGKVNFVLSGIVTSSLWDAQAYGPTGEFWQDRALAVQMCDPVIDYANVDLVLFYPSLQNVSYGTKPDIQTQEGNFSKSIIQFAQGQLELSGVMVHEIGHAVFRLVHSSRVDCGVDTYRENYTDCTVVEYGNKFDAMGWLSTGHFGAWNKYLAGQAFVRDWIQKQDVQSDGDYSLKVLELPTTGTQLLRIPYRTHPLCIEYRKAIGIDGALRDQLAGAAYGSLDSIPDQGGILLNFCYTDEVSERGPVDLPFTQLLSGAANVLDPSPHVTNNLNDQERDNADIFLREGVNFSNEALGLGIRWERGGDENTIIVHIDIDENRL